LPRGSVSTVWFHSAEPTSEDPPSTSSTVPVI
jgi:hypothetical protein